MVCDYVVVVVVVFVSSKFIYMGLSVTVGGGFEFVYFRESVIGDDVDQWSLEFVLSSQ